MTINLSKLKELAEAAKRDPYDNLAANDYGMSMPPATALELIAEIERHRQVNAEGCKPEISNRPAGGHTSDAPAMHGLDKAEGCKPDLITSTAVLWRHRENKPGRVWNYTRYKEVAEKAIGLGHEVQGFGDPREIERLSEENLHYRNLQIEADDLIRSLFAQLAELPEKLIAAIDHEQERLSAEDYLMDYADCIKVIREAASIRAEQSAPVERDKRAMGRQA